MTFRTRTTVKPTRRRARQSDTRRAVYINIAFGFCVAAAFCLLGSIFFAGYYSDHFTVIASVNGTSISKDAVRARTTVNLARYEREIQDYLQLRNEGKITATEYDTVVGGVTTNESDATLYSDAMNQLTQEAMLAQYADQHGITVTDKQITDQIVADATIAEQRHVMVIGVAPTPTPPSSVPTPDQILAAQTQANKFHDDVLSKAQTWDEASKASNSGTVSQGTVGDLFLTTKKALNLDPDLVDAIFNLKAVNDLTPVLKGADGLYRFATVTEIVPPFVDNDWQKAIDQQASDEAYRQAVKAEVLQIALRGSIEGQYATGTSVQRHVREITVSAGYGAAGSGDEVKIEIMVFAPYDGLQDFTGLPLTDQAWIDAKARADAAVSKLKADVTQFSNLEKDSVNNNDQQWTSTGGVLPWFPLSIYQGDAASYAGIGMPALGAAVFADGLTPNSVVGPVAETSAGYVVAVLLGRRPEPSQRISDTQLRIASGTPFATEAQAVSEAVDSANGGDMGWVTRYSLPQDLEDAIFQTPVGGTSRVVLIQGQSASFYYIFQVLAEETRTPTASEAAELRTKVFGTWLTDLTAHTNIWTDQTGLTSLYPAPSPT